MAALGSPQFSPYQMLADAGLKVSQLTKQRNAAADGSGAGVSRHPARKRRVRRAAPVSGTSAGGGSKAVKVQWPEDRE